MTAGAPIRIGVVGCAAIAVRSVIPAIRALPETFELVGVASRSEAKAEATAARFATRPFVGYERLLELDELDAVYIPLPNALHFAQVSAALERDLHVYVEKPLGASADEVGRLCELSRAHDCVLLENFQFRFHRQLAVLTELLGEGRIGELRAVQSSFGFPPLPNPDDIRYQAQLGGGALLDAGVYPIRISQLLLGDDIRVSAAKRTMDPALGVDIWGGGFLEQVGGPLFSEIAFGFDHHYQCSVEVWGQHGKISADRIFTAPPGHAPIIRLETHSGAEAIEVEPQDHFAAMLGHFARLVRGEADGEAERESSLRLAELVDEFRSLSDD